MITGNVDDVLAMQARIKELEREREDQHSFMAYMKEWFDKLPSMHSPGPHDSTPPMMWPELIVSIWQKQTEKLRAKSADTESQLATWQSACRELLNAEHPDHFAARMSDSEMVAIERIKLLVAGL